MNLGIFLQPGESLKLMSKSGQDIRLIEFYLKPYSKHFKKVFIFSYEDETGNLPKNVILVKNKYKFLHRLIYASLLPILNYKYIKECDVVRGLGFASGISAIFMTKPFVVNWAYDYYSFVKVDKKYQYLPLYFLLEKLIFWKASNVFVATNEKFKKLKGSKFIYLPNGVELEIFNYQKNLRAGLIFIGRLEKQKNLLFMIDALALLPKKFRKLTIVGQGSLESEIKKAAKDKGIELKQIPSIPHTQLPKILKDHSIFLLSSYHEGVPKVLIEAMAMGLVPVTTNFPTAKEIVTEGITGFVTDFNPVKYADKIKLLLLDSKLQKKMSKSASARIKSIFNQDELIKQEISVFKNL